MLKRFGSSNFFQIILIFCICFQLFQTIFAQRSLLVSKYDALYWKDRVEHSQWVLPLSQRTIGDDGLFAYVGYTLAHGADPSLLNPETGPVGKYLIGVSILLLRNPYYATLFLGLGSALSFFLITEHFLHKKTASLFATFLLVSDPLFASQLVSTSLDVIQLFFLLLTTWLFIKSLGKKLHLLYSAASGIALGCFSAIKFPLLTGLLFVLFFCIYFQKKQMKNIIAFICGIFIGFLFFYLQYFHLGHSLKDFLKLQKYIIAFYGKSGLVVHHQAILDILFLGKFPDVVTGKLSAIHEWWIMWPLSFLILLNVVFLVFLQKKKDWFFLGLGCFSLLSTFLFFVIPVYTRYLLLIIPFYFLFFTYGLSLFIVPRISWQKIIFSLFVVGSIFYLHIFWIPSPQATFTYFIYNMSHGYFQDIYAEDIANTNSLPGREAFRLISQKAFDQAQIEQVSFHQLRQSQQGNTLHISGMLTYTTRNLGTFKEEKTFTMQNIHGVWKIMWSWNDLIQGYQPGDALLTQIIVGKRGIVTDQDNHILAQDTDGYFVQIDPSSFQFQKENSFLSLASELSGLKAVHIQNAYLENPYPQEKVPLFTSFHEWNSATITALTNFPGISVIPYPARIYADTVPVLVQNTLFPECCTQVYSSTSYQGVSGFEKKYNNVLQGQNGGSLVLLDKKGKVIRTVVAKQAHDGENITVHL